MDKTERSQSIEGRGVYFYLDVNLGPKEGKEHIKRAMSRLAGLNSPMPEVISVCFKKAYKKA